MYYAKLIDSSRLMLENFDKSILSRRRESTCGRWFLADSPYGVVWGEQGTHIVFSYRELPPIVFDSQATTKSRYRVAELTDRQATGPMFYAELSTYLRLAGLDR